MAELFRTMPRTVSAATNISDFTQEVEKVVSGLHAPSDPAFDETLGWTPEAGFNLQSQTLNGVFTSASALLARATTTPTDGIYQVRFTYGSDGDAATNGTALVFWDSSGTVPAAFNGAADPMLGAYGLGLGNTVSFRFRVQGGQVTQGLSSVRGFHFENNAGFNLPATALDLYLVSTNAVNTVVQNIALTKIS